MDNEAIDDGLAKSADRIAKHMNDDHPDSLVAYARFYAKLDAVSAVMTGLSAQGLTLDAVLANGSMQKGVFVPYNTPLTSAGAVRKVVVSMHFEAYNGLGTAYKLRTGFYQNAAKQAWTHMPARVRWGAVVSLGAAVAVAVAAVRRLRR